MEKYCKFYLSFLAILLLTFAFPSQGWAGDSYYYAQLTAHVSSESSGRGSVYAGTKTTPGEYRDDKSESDTQMSTNDKTKSFNFYAFAKTTNDDYKFLGWSETPIGATLYDENDKGKSYRTYPVSVGTTEDNPNNKNVYAYFARKIYAKATAGIDANGSGMGTVCVAWTSTDSPSYAETSEATYNDYGSTAPQESIKKDVYFYAKEGTNAAGKSMIFQGWYDEGGNWKSGENPYTAQDYTFSGENDMEVGLALYARFKDPDKVAQPKIELAGLDGITELTLKIDEEQNVVFVSYDAATLSMLNTPNINVNNRVDPGSDPIVIWDATNRKLTANRAGTATVTFSHPATDDFNAADFTFTIHVEKYDPTFSWKTSTLFVQEYGFEDLIETPSDGAWSLTSNKESVFASLSSVGITSTTPTEGSVILTFSQSASYKYNAISAQSQEFNVYDESFLATFSVNNTSYNMLAEAITASTAGGEKYNIIVTKSGMVVPGDYTIPSGVTLLVPHDNTTTVRTVGAQVTEATAISEYRRLTLVAGVRLNLSGTLCISASQFCGSNGTPGPGSVSGAYGCLDMSQGGEIIVENTGKIYALGFIVGSGDQSKSGNILVHNGGQVYENLVIQDMHGGNGMTSILNVDAVSAIFSSKIEGKNDYKIFPFNQYYIQNIQPKIVIEYGGELSAICGVGAEGSFVQQPITLVGKAGGACLFGLNIGASIEKWYDDTRDYQCYKVHGSCEVRQILLEMTVVVVGTKTVSMNSTKFILPLTSNMDITVASDATLSIPYEAKMLPGTKMTIENGGVVNLSKPLYVYDYREWGTYAMGEYAKPMNSSKRNAPINHARKISSASDLGYAVLQVDGLLNINSGGALYTTNSGSSIVSSGMGRIVYKVEPANSPYLYEINGTLGSSADGPKIGSGVKDAAYGTPIACTPAQLHNADDTYTPTSGAPAGSTFTYINGMWVRPEEICAEVYIGANGDNYITYQGNWVKVTCDGSTCDCTDESGNKYKYNDPEWVKVFDLKWDANGGTFGTYGETIIETLEEGATITAPANPTREGYTFAGWDKKIPTTMPAEDMTITAKWTEVPTTAKYTVKHYKLHIKDKQKFAEPFKTDESEEEIGSEVTPEFEVIKGYDPPAERKTITISANPEENVVVYEYSISETNKLEVDEGDTKTINDSTEAYTVILAPGKTMNITGKGSVTAQNLVLQSVPGDNTGANLATTSGLDILGKVCIEINMNKSGTMDDKLYYCFSVPFNVNVADGVERLNETNDNWESAVLNKNYRVYTYSESDRAAKGPQDSNWTQFNGPQFAPGVFYLCEFDNSNYNRYRFYAADNMKLDNKKPISVANTTGDPLNVNGGWNGVANNGLTDNQLSGGNIKFIQILNSKDKSFDAFDTNSKPLAIGNAAMVQVSASGSVFVGETSSAVAARRMGETASTKFINVRLYKENQDKHVDQIFIRASEDASEQYVAGIDLSKATMGTPKVARLWVNDYNLQLVANEAIMTNDQATFSLGMSAPANGEYTIALDEVPNDATIYLTENGSAIWNLNIAPAPLSLSKGTENSYGLRLVRKINNVVTGFDEAVLNGNVQKVILNDHMYIIRDGKVYSAHGHVIK